MKTPSLLPLCKPLAEPPTWVVHGTNWRVEVPLNAYNAEFDDETQAYEAASMAIMVFKGSEYARPDIFLVMENGDEYPLLSTTMMVHKKGEQATKGFYPFTHVILANQGFYRESFTMQLALHKELEGYKKF